MNRQPFHYVIYNLWWIFSLCKNIFFAWLKMKISHYSFLISFLILANFKVNLIFNSLIFIYFIFELSLTHTMKRAQNMLTLSAVFRICWLYLLMLGKLLYPPPNIWCPEYDIWWWGTTLSLSLLPGQFWSWVIVAVRVLYMG